VQQEAVEHQDLQAHRDPRGPLVHRDRMGPPGLLGLVVYRDLLVRTAPLVLTASLVQPDLAGLRAVLAQLGHKGLLGRQGLPGLRVVRAVPAQRVLRVHLAYQD